MTGTITKETPLSAPPDTPLSARITGLGWVTAAGYGRGRSGELPHWQPGEPKPPAAVLKTLSGGSRFGRLDLFSQIGVAAVALALEDAGRLDSKTSSASCAAGDCGLICATTSGCELTDHNFYKTVQADPRLASPGLFVYTLASSFLGEAALRFAITGTSLALIEAQPSGAEALRLGLEQLAYGDEEVMIAGLANLFATERGAPFFSGALFLVLEKEDLKPDPFPAIISYNPDVPGFYYNNRACPDMLSLLDLMPV